MSYKSKIHVKENLTYLRDLYNKEKNKQGKLKLQSLILLKENPDKKQEYLASNLCIGYSTLRRWYSTYMNNGLEEFLLVKPGRGRKNIINLEIHEALAEKVNDSKAPLQGYWDAVRWVYEEFGIVIKYHTLRQYLIREFKTKLKTPRKSHYKKDEQAIEAFLKTTR